MHWKKNFVDHLKGSISEDKSDKITLFSALQFKCWQCDNGTKAAYLLSVEKTLREGSSSKSHFSFSPCQPILVKWHNVEKMHHRSRRNTYFQLLIVFVYWGAATTLPLVPVLIQMRTHWVEIVLIWNTKRMPYESRHSNREPSKSSFSYFVTTVKLKKQALHAGQGTHGDAVIWIRSDIFFSNPDFSFFHVSFSREEVPFHVVGLWVTTNSTRHHHQISSDPSQSSKQY